MITKFNAGERVSQHYETSGMNWEISKNISVKYHHDGVCRSIGEVRSNNVRIFPGYITFLNEPIKKEI